jgi:hypothetical protein
MTLDMQLINFWAWVRTQKNIKVKQRVEILKFMGAVDNCINADTYIKTVDLFDRYCKATFPEYQAKKILAYIEDKHNLIIQMIEEKWTN